MTMRHSVGTRLSAHAQTDTHTRTYTHLHILIHNALDVLSEGMPRRHCETYQKTLDFEEYRATLIALATYL